MAAHSFLEVYIKKTLEFLGPHFYLTFLMIPNSKGCVWYNSYCLIILFDI